MAKIQGLTGYRKGIRKDYAVVGVDNGRIAVFISEGTPNELANRVGSLRESGYQIVRGGVLYGISQEDIPQLARLNNLPEEEAKERGLVEILSEIREKIKPSKRS